MSTTPSLAAFEKQKKQRLLVGIVFDLLGMATYLFPGLGEAADLAWAPIAAATYFAMYRGLTGLIGGSFVFIEEITVADFIPTFTITWFWVYIINGEKNKARFLNNQLQKTGDGSVDITHLQDKKKITA